MRFVNETMTSGQPRQTMLSIRSFPTVILLLVFSINLASCGMFGKKEKQPEYYSAVEAPPLVLPEGLDRPGSSGALVITTPLAPLPKKEMQTVPPRVSSQSASQEDGNSVVKWSSAGAYLFVRDTPESVYRRLGYVLERSGLTVSELENKGGYRFEYWHDSKDPDEGFFSKMAFWRDDAPNYSGIYHAVTEAEGENSRVYIKNSDGSDSDPDAAEHMLSILGERLG